MSRSLRDMVVLITGSSIGIGRATAIRFAQEGCRVVVTYYQDEEEARETSARCMDMGASDVMLTELNVLDNKSINLAIEKVMERHDGIDILVNNAGIFVRKKLSDQNFEEIEQQLRTNLEGVVKVTRACLPHLRDMIISVSSPTSMQGSSGLAPYAASKAGVRMFMQSMADELGLLVYNLIPRRTATRMTDFHGDPPEKVAEVMATLARQEYDVRSGEDIMVYDPPSRVMETMVRGV